MSFPRRNYRKMKGCEHARPCRVFGKSVAAFQLTQYREGEAFFAAKYLIRREAADGGVEQFDHVEGGHGLFAAAAEGAHELEEAAGVGGDDGLRLGGEEVADLAVAELLGGFGLEQVVDTGGAAAEPGFGDLGDFELGDSGEELAGLLMDSLGVPEVAGIVIGDFYR